MRTAYRLAKLGTLSATAQELGVHRSTVMRHIDVLESALGVTLFQRNDRGYLPTEAGLEIMRLGEITELQFTQFANKAQNKEAELEGQLVITCVSELAQLLLPVIQQYQQTYPKMRVEIAGDTRLFALEYGEADIAIRAGTKPQTPDNVVLPFCQLEVRLCAHQAYIDSYGLPTADTLHQHKFIALNERLAHLPWNEWIHTHAAVENISLTSSAAQIITAALHQGLGISVSTVQAIAQNEQLIALDLHDPWTLDCWLLVHRDILNIRKVRKFIDLVKENPPPDGSLLG